MHFFNRDESAGRRNAASIGGPTFREGMMLERIQPILETCETDTPLLPRTELYNEGWLLRLVLDWFSTHQVPDHPLSFYQDSRWFPEAWLPSAFLHGPQPESWTHADGVIGHFTIGEKGKAALSLRAGATHFVVLEAKLFSRLASGVTHAPHYDQAAHGGLYGRSAQVCVSATSCSLAPWLPRTGTPLTDSARHLRPGDGS
jgi:hypothetical protein